MKTSFLTAFKTTVALLLVLAVITPPTVSAADISCGNVLESTIKVASAGNNMDEKVWGCPDSYHWESCCATCGSSLKNAGTLSGGWYCEKAAFNTGIYLKGCSKAGSCV